MQMLPWIVALAAFALFSVVLLAWAVKSAPRRERDGGKVDLPTDWALAPRPVFSVDERRVYRLLREAFPHHVLLAKLPLVRFCQPTDPASVRYWFDLLGASHVTFAICSPNGRVMAALDLDTDRALSKRAAQIKQSVISACRVRYLRCPIDRPPSIAELQLLIPNGAAGFRGPQPAPAAPPSEFSQARDSLAGTIASRRAELDALWQDSAVFQDSFFAPDSRGHSGASEFGATVAPLHRPPEAGPVRPPGPPPRAAFASFDNRPDPLTGLETSEWDGGEVVDTLPPDAVRPTDRAAP